jgi:tagatose 1,6-diphosphate aldolase
MGIRLHCELPQSPEKLRRLRALADARGVIAAVAIDQRRSLRRLLASVAAEAEASITDAQLVEFKAAVTAALTPQASAVLLDPEYGLDASRSRTPGCGLLLTYELDGYDNPRPHRMLALLPGVSVRRLRDLGADAIKILLSYSPDADAQANDDKRAWIERIGNECDALDMPFLLEPVTYDCAPRRKPELIVETMEEFSKPVYKVDVLKVEFPVVASAPEWTRAEALEWYRAADRAATVPYIYLSAGVGIDQFLGSLELAAESGARWSGVLCGRAGWQDGASAYVRGGRAALDAWLATEGAANWRRIHRLLAAALPAVAV